MSECALSRLCLRLRVSHQTGWFEPSATFSFFFFFFFFFLAAFASAFPGFCLSALVRAFSFGSLLVVLVFACWLSRDEVTRQSDCILSVKKNAGQALRKESSAPVRQGVTPARSTHKRCLSVDLCAGLSVATPVMRCS